MTAEPKVDMEGCPEPTSDKRLYRQTMWAEVVLTYEEDAAEWRCSEIDGRDSDTRKTVELAAETFPLGTKLIISEPVDPQTGLADIPPKAEGLTSLPRSISEQIAAPLADRALSAFKPKPSAYFARYVGDRRWTLTIDDPRVTPLGHIVSDIEARPLYNPATIEDIIKEALADALSASPQGQGAGVSVRPLEWRYDDFQSLWQADSALGIYQAWIIAGNGCYRPPDAPFGLDGGNSIDRAKAAAQSDYTARIMSALVLSAIDLTSSEVAAVAWVTVEALRQMRASNGGFTPHIFTTNASATDKDGNPLVPLFAASPSKTSEGEKS